MTALTPAAVLLLLLSTGFGYDLKYVMKRGANEHLKKSSDGKLRVYNGTFRQLFTSPDGLLTRWVQEVDGIPVYGSVLTTQHHKSGGIVRLQGKISHGKTTVEKLIITPSTAVKSLRSYWRHKKVEINLMEEPKLYIYPDMKGPDVLAYEVHYAPKDPGYSEMEIIGFVQARTGKVLETRNNARDAMIPALSGNEKIGMEKYDMEVEKQSATCYHKDLNRRIEVIDMKNSVRQKGKTSEFECSDAPLVKWDKTNGDYSPRNGAMRNAQRFVDMWQLYVPDVPIHKDCKTDLTLLVHYNSKGFNQAMFVDDKFKFGDGNATFFPTTQLDIVCHELAHGMTTWHMGYLGGTRQGLGIDEAYSDMVGETCDMEYEHKNDYLIGDDYNKKKGGCYRDMCNPAKTGGIDDFNKYSDKIDPHHTAGIYSKVWCILAKKWGYVEAFQVFTRANRYFWNPYETMPYGVCGVEQAARSLDMPVEDVTAAFAKTNLECPIKDSVRTYSQRKY